MIAPLSTHRVKNRAFFFCWQDLRAFVRFLSGLECRQRYHKDIIIPVGKSSGSHDHHEIWKMQRILSVAFIRSQDEVAKLSQIVFHSSNVY